MPVVSESDISPSSASSETSCLAASAASVPLHSVLWQRLPLVLGVLGAVFFTVGAAPIVGAFYLARKYEGRTQPGLQIRLTAAEVPIPIGDVPYQALPARVHEIVEGCLSRRVYLRAGHERVPTTWRDLGVVIDESALLGELKASGHSGQLFSDLLAYFQGRRRGRDIYLPVELDEKRTIESLIEVKDEVDRAPLDARLDLERHTIASEKPGLLLRVYDSVVAVQYAVRSLRSGTAVNAISLSVAESAPQIHKEDLKNIDVSHVLSSWETHYSTAAIDSDRTYNLKVGADKLNGYILWPGQAFSFNAAVGDRTEKEGYRVAPVISGGELIDGLAGGMCQIASTLHAAAFFAGLEVLRTTPHSRPSTYIPMGLDSTVVYPSVDLKLKNSYDFPVVIHYVVNQGSVKVELLGKQTSNHVAFEREILSETKFSVTTRSDPEMPAGQKIVEQEGYNGYHIKRRRYIYTGKWKLDPKNENRPNPEGLVSKKEWEISYPATVQIVRIGSGPPNLKPKPLPPSHRIPPIPASAKPFYFIFR